ncbi:MAG: hypothetical protein IIU30_10805, partial [Treponema sp.]|nr:hypothetical protein [Treponema sp.]
FRGLEQAAPRMARHFFTKKLVSFPTENSWVKIARRQFLPHALPIRPHATATMEINFVFRSQTNPSENPRCRGIGN